MTSQPPKSNRRVGLYVKLVGGLLLLSLLPLAVSSLLIGNIGEVAQNFASHHVEELRPHLTRAQGAYRQLIEAKKSEYQEVAQRLAGDRTLRNRLQERVEDGWDEVAATLLSAHPDLIEIHIESGQGIALGQASRVSSLPPDGFRALRLQQAIDVGGAKLELVFAADLQPVKDLQALGEALVLSHRVDKVRSSLPSSYRLAFLLLVGAVVVLVTLLALVFARRISHRIALLVAGTRDVAMGNLASRVDVDGSDELAELAAAFNSMVRDLREERQKTLYLQRIGAWQDVARKLAHEIKNPLTPIQLVVQQAVSSYPGDDARYKKLLASCDEIVREEVEGLRRLVDAFRDLGRLPKVEAVALPLSTIISDLRANAELAPLLEVVGGDDSIMLSADRLLLRRALVNLLDNGVDAGKDAGHEGKVVLRCESGEGTVRFVVDDEGSGVPSNKREQIFDPYVTSKETGTGLGLAIARKIALDHRGDLSIDEALAPTGGARFVLAIPMSEAMSAGTPAPPEDS